jgi:hypothetical protein
MKNPRSTFRVTLTNKFEFVFLGPRGCSKSKLGAIWNVFKEQGSLDLDIILWGTKGLSKRPTCIGTERARTHPFYSILFYSILFYPILFYSTLLYYIILYYIILYYIILYYIPFHSTLFYSILFHSILFFYSVLFYSIHKINFFRNKDERERGRIVTYEVCLHLYHSYTKQKNI